ncbi:MAG: hypothetical protein WCQ65_11685, partial [Fermentimonas sp.]
PASIPVDAPTSIPVDAPASINVDASGIQMALENAAGVLRDSLSMVGENIASKIENTTVNVNVPNSISLDTSNIEVLASRISEAAQMIASKDFTVKYEGGTGGSIGADKRQLEDVLQKIQDDLLNVRKDSFVNSREIEILNSNVGNVKDMVNERTFSMDQVRTEAEKIVNNSLNFVKIELNDISSNNSRALSEVIKLRQELYHYKDDIEGKLRNTQNHTISRV